MNQVCQVRLMELSKELKADQNFIAAMLLGFVAAIICASLWGMFSYLSQSQGMIVSVLIGGVIGYVVREAGNGVSTHYAVLSVILTAVAVILGEMMTGAVEAALYYEITPWEAFFKQPFSDRCERFIRNVTILDVYFIVTATAFSTKFALRPLSTLQKKAVSMPVYSITI